MAADARIIELVRMTAMGRERVGPDAAQFANRHDTPEGQFTLQELHDIAARGGAVCQRSNARMASGHESSAVQQSHDEVVAHGAHCSTTVAARFSAVDVLRVENARLERENAEERRLLENGRRVRARAMASITPFGRAQFATEKPEPDGVRRSQTSHPAVKAAAKAGIADGDHAFVLEDGQGDPIAAYATPGEARDHAADIKGNRTYAVRVVHPATCDHTLPGDRASMSNDRVRDLIEMTAYGRHATAQDRSG